MSKKRASTERRMTMETVLTYAPWEQRSWQVLHSRKSRGKPVQLIVGEGYNHFEFPETLGNPSGLLGRAALEQMRLAPGRT